MRLKKLILPNLHVIVSIIAVVAMVVIFSSYRTLYLSTHQIVDDQTIGKTAQTIDDGPLFIIKEISKEIGLTDLKNEVLPKEATEIRFWVGFSHGILKTLIVKNDGVTWTATFIPEFSQSAAPSDIVRSLAAPTNGWQSLADKLQQLGLYDLLGHIPERISVLDTTNVVVEIKTSDSYKVLRFHGVFYFQNEEIMKIEKILHTLSSEFSIKLY